MYASSLKTIRSFIQSYEQLQEKNTEVIYTDNDGQEYYAELGPKVGKDYILTIKSKIGAGRHTRFSPGDEVRAGHEEFEKE